MAEHRSVYTDRVQFSDTDMAGIVHFSNFFRFMERAEHAFFRSIDLSIWENPNQIPDEERIAWPRVHASCDFHAPLQFQEVYTVELLIEEIRTKAVRYLIRVWKEDNTLSAEGRMAAACVRKDTTSGKMAAVPIPDRIRSLIEVAPEATLRRHPPS